MEDGEISTYLTGLVGMPGAILQWASRWRPACFWEVLLYLLAEPSEYTLGYFTLRV